MPWSSSPSYIDYIAQGLCAVSISMLNANKDHGYYKQTFSCFCSRLEEGSENDSKQELEQIFHLLMGCSKVSRMHLSSSLAPMQLADRFVA